LADLKGHSASIRSRRFDRFGRLDNMYRLVTVPVQLLALLLMLVAFFGDPLSDRGQVRQVAVRSQIQAYLTALNNYKQDTGLFPTSNQGLQALVQNPGVTHWQGPYVDKQISTDPWGRAYVYRNQPGQEPQVVSLGSGNAISNQTPAIPQARFRPSKFLPLGLFLLSALTFFGLAFLPRLLRKHNA
jgi:general secretion pathway protein G